MTRPTTPRTNAERADRLVSGMKLTYLPGRKEPLFALSVRLHTELRALVASLAASSVLDLDEEDEEDDAERESLLSGRFVRPGVELRDVPAIGLGEDEKELRTFVESFAPGEAETDGDGYVVAP